MKTITTPNTLIPGLDNAIRRLQALGATVQDNEQIINRYVVTLGDRSWPGLSIFKVLDLANQLETEANEKPA